MKILKTILKGKLTNISLASIIAGVMAIQSDVIPAFTEASNMPINWLMIVGAAGSIWGQVRRTTKAYKAK